MERRVGFGPRFGALLIDVVIVIVAMVIIGLVMQNWFGRILQSVAVLAYMFTDVINAGTPGKKLLGLTIAGEDGNAAPQDVLLKRYLIKQAGNLISFLGAVLAFPLIGTLLATVGGLVGLGIGLASLYLVLQPAKQALYDQFAKTAVFRATELASGTSYAAGSTYAVPADQVVTAPPPPPPPIAPAPEA